MDILVVSQYGAPYFMSYFKGIKTLKYENDLGNWFKYNWVHLNYDSIVMKINTDQERLSEIKLEDQPFAAE